MFEKKSFDTIGKFSNQKITSVSFEEDVFSLKQKPKIKIILGSNKVCVNQKLKFLLQSTEQACWGLRDSSNKNKNHKKSNEVFVWVLGTYM